MLFPKVHGMVQIIVRNKNTVRYLYGENKYVCGFKQNFWFDELSMPEAERLQKLEPL
jgi:hypothetical protein